MNIYIYIYSLHIYAYFWCPIIFIIIIAIIATGRQLCSAIGPRLTPSLITAVTSLVTSTIQWL